MEIKRADHKREVINCECGSYQHMAVLEWYRWEDGEEEFTISLQMRQWQGFWKRAWMAFKYVFKIGRENDLGWDSMLVTEDDCHALQHFIDLKLKKTKDCV